MALDLWIVFVIEVHYGGVCCMPAALLFEKLICFVCFVTLRPKSTAMVMARRSVHLTTLFPGQALTSS